MSLDTIFWLWKILGMLRQALRGGASSLQSGGILLCSLREDVVRSWCLVSLSLSVHKPPALGVLLGARPSFPLLEPSPLSVPLRWPNGAKGLQLLWITDLWRGFLFFQMRWYPPSEATQQGWKSRQFC